MNPDSAVVPEAQSANSDEHWSLLFAVRRSVRYHRRRERFFDRWHRFGALASAIAGSAAIASLLAKFSATLVTGLVAAAAVAGALELVFGFARSARLHNDLAREFTTLEQELVQAGEDVAPARLRDLEGRRLEIESREPPVLRVLDAMCHDELVTALDIEEGQRTDPTWVQRMLAHWFDVGAHRLRKQGGADSRAQPLVR